MTELERTFGGNEFVGKIELFCNFLSKCIHPEGFGRIMSAGIEIEL